MLYVCKIARRWVSWHLESIFSSCLSLRRCTIRHANSGMHLMPSLTDTSHLLTNVIDSAVWPRSVFERRVFQRKFYSKASEWVWGSSRRKLTLLVELVTCILEVSVSSLGWDTGFFKVLLSSAEKISPYYRKWSNDRFLILPFNSQFIVS
jgi:hypothetical protein